MKEIQVFQVQDLIKPSGRISTGVGFLDHMIDQFNSHAQIGVSLEMGAAEIDNDHAYERTNRVNGEDQKELLEHVGVLLGAQFKRLLAEAKNPGQSSRFCCPLDEALVRCQLKRVDGTGSLSSFTLAPYGKFPRTGRTHIGHLQVRYVELFWKGLAQSSGLDICLDKIRGDNAHHIVESAFKAFSRALRNLLDGVDTVNVATPTLEALYGRASENYRASLALTRKASVERKTKETSISVTLRLDGGTSGVTVDTGIRTLDKFFETLADEAWMSLDLKCKGDKWIDEHHTAEDVAIAVGQVLAEALGTKAGLNRMWSAMDKQGSSVVEVTMDLSNRPCLTHNLSLDSEMVGDLSLEMFEHVLDSLVVNSRMTVHVEETEFGGDFVASVAAVARAFGRALRFCMSVDQRRAGATASSKGTLSV